MTLKDIKKEDKFSPLGYADFYCKKDVDVLYESVVKFREMLL